MHDEIESSLYHHTHHIHTHTQHTHTHTHTHVHFLIIINNSICVLGRVRLVGGSGPHEGRVEVLYNSTWGTVCDDFWDTTDAGVVCRELSYGGAQSAPPFATFGQGNGPIWLDDVTCSGSESSIQDCFHSGWGQHNCFHRKDAGAVCSELVL